VYEPDRIDKIPHTLCRDLTLGMALLENPSNSARCEVCREMTGGVFRVCNMPQHFPNALNLRIELRCCGKNTCLGDVMTVIGFYDSHVSELCQ
jgi:hypothetical protein